MSPLADPGGASEKRQPLGPISVIFMQFSARILPNNRLAPPPPRLRNQTIGWYSLWSWRPRLGNPGSASGHVILVSKLYIKLYSIFIVYY